jgi:hypothetical protein
MQYDYRVVYANIMRDWMLVDNERLNTIFPNTTDPAKGIMNGGTSDGTHFFEMAIASQTIVGTESFIGDRFALDGCFPNPAKDKTRVRFKLNSAYHVSIALFDKQGKKVKTIVNKEYVPGSYEEDTDVSALPDGVYICEFKCGFFRDSKKLVIAK